MQEDVGVLEFKEQPKYVQELTDLPYNQVGPANESSQFIFYKKKRMLWFDSNKSYWISFAYAL